MVPRRTGWILAIALAAVMPGELLAAPKLPRRTSAIPRTGRNVHRPPARTPAARPDAPTAGTRPQLALQLGHSDRVTAVAFTHDSQTLITAGADKNVRIWNLREGELKAITP